MQRRGTRRAALPAALARLLVVALLFPGAALVLDAGPVAAAPVAKRPSPSASPAPTASPQPSSRAPDKRASPSPSPTFASGAPSPAPTAAPRPPRNKRRSPSPSASPWPSRSAAPVATSPVAAPVPGAPERSSSPAPFIGPVAPPFIGPVAPTHRPSRRTSAHPSPPPSPSPSPSPRGSTRREPTQVGLVSGAGAAPVVQNLVRRSVQDPQVPVGIAAVVLLFLLVQHHIDRRDPKLRATPRGPYDVLEFGSTVRPA